MFNITKKYICVVFLALCLTGCSTIEEYCSIGGDDEVYQSENVKYSDDVYMDKSGKRRVKRKYNSIRKQEPCEKSQKIKDAEKRMADMRGVLTDDVYDQLEETQPINPIKGYNRVSKNGLRKVNKSAPTKLAKKAPVKKVVRKEVPKPEVKKVVKKTPVLQTAAVPMEKPKQTIKRSKRELAKMITPEKLRGLSPQEILGIMRIPSNIHRDGQMETWVYENHTCSANLYFYAGSCNYVETAFERKDYEDPAGCLTTFGL